MTIANKILPVVLISGAASGIGLASACRAARDGYQVVGGYFPGDPHDPIAAGRHIAEQGAPAIMLPLDVADAESVDQFAHHAFQHFGRIDGAVANAGILRHAPLASMTDRQWDEMLGVDLGGVIRLFRAAARHMQTEGSLVAISSIAGAVYGWEEHAHYAAAKAGVIGVCRSLAVELASRQIRCNAVVPGLIETPQSLDPVNSLGPEGLALAAEKVPLGRIGKAADVAELVNFLLGAQSAYITGQAIIIDGGITIRMPR
jgi:3-oxoacyl-[acyl-carrier protein] reductase